MIHAAGEGLESPVRRRGKHRSCHSSHKHVSTCTCILPSLSPLNTHSALPFPRDMGSHDEYIPSAHVLAWLTIPWPTLITCMDMWGVVMSGKSITRANHKHEGVDVTPFPCSLLHSLTPSCHVVPLFAVFGDSRLRICTCMLVWCSRRTKRDSETSACSEFAAGFRFSVIGFLVRRFSPNPYFRSFDVLPHGE